MVEDWIFFLREHFEKFLSVSVLIENKRAKIKKKKSNKIQRYKNILIVFQIVIENNKVFLYDAITIGRIFIKTKRS
jgi:hypothetical protein